VSAQKNFPGNKHNMLTLVECVEKARGGHKWLVRCDCGTEKVISVRDVVSGHTKSCGCMTAAWRSANSGMATHRMTDTREYKSWCHMLSRCFSEKNPKYEYYGGRGITVCDAWAMSFAAFYEHMGSCPTGYTLDRIDCDGNYDPGNCRWADGKTQAQNRRFIKSVTVFGREMPVVEAERALDLGYGSIRNKAAKKGVTLQQAADHFERKWSAA
jgi:hypothetical protein